MFSAKNTVPQNHYPLWRYLLIIALVLLACLYALPNIFGESPAVQVSPKDSTAVTPALVQQIEGILQQNHVPYQGITSSAYTVELRFSNTTVQIEAQDALQQALGDHYTTAINLSPNTPPWLQALGANPMKLGLDLQGGM